MSYAQRICYTYDGAGNRVKSVGCFASIGDTTWVDLNANGLQDPLEPGLAGVTVTLLNEFDIPVTIDGNGSPIVPFITSSTGKYFFENLNPGNYKIHFGKPPGYVFTTQNVGGFVIENRSNNKQSNQNTEITPTKLVPDELTSRKLLLKDQKLCGTNSVNLNKLIPKGHESGVWSSLSKENEAFDINYAKAGTYRYSVKSNTSAFEGTVQIVDISPDYASKTSIKYASLKEKNITPIFRDCGT